MISDYFTLAVRNLRKRKLRTWLTMLGIFISIATIFLLISLSLGLQNAVKAQFETLGTDKFFILPKTGFLGLPGSVGGDILTEKDIQTISKIRGIKDYTYVAITNAKVEFSGETKYFMVIGLPLDHTQIYTETNAWKAEEGTMFKAGDEGSVLLGNLFKTGNVFQKPVRAGNKITINGKDFKVRSIATPIGNPSDDTSIIMTLDDFRTLFNISERVDEIVVQVTSGETVKDVADRTEKKLRQSKGQTEKTQDFSISTPEELLGSFQTILNILTGFLGGIAAISLLVGGVGIANTMYTSVLERTREIGVMKAIGAKNKNILLIFLIESGLLGLVGAAIGVGLGYGAGKIIESIAANALGTNLLQIATPWYLIFGCLMFGFLIGAVSGTLPARRASKIKVVDALRYE